MVPIKSYTDIEQSRELAKIISVETADMFLALTSNGIIPVMSKCIDETLVTKENTAIPCWSLSALLNTLPEIHLKKYIYGNITKYYVTLVGIRQFNSSHYENPVDACYEMILQLHELNLL